MNEKKKDYSYGSCNFEQVHCLNCRAGRVHADEGAFDSLHHMRLEVWSKDEGQQRVKAVGKELTVS